MLRDPVMHCDRLPDRASGTPPKRPSGRAGRLRAQLGRGLVLMVGLGVAVASGCGKDPEVRAVTMSKEVDAALATQKWELAEKKAQEIVNLGKLSDVSRDQAKLKIEQARSEQQAKLLYQKFVGYVTADQDAAVSAYRDMPESSYYRQQSKAEYEKLRPSFIEDHLGRAQSALGGARCDDVKAQLQLVLDVDPQNSKAIEIGKKPCGKK